ncbi:rhamnulokinase [Silvibacterium acidisoli]|uniref:rhamnulokinase n=1 Tax=Acidobacteriaceae bacterium ZG23-2 TaxID=2883246 RepID=UPI00406CD303
MSDTRVKDRRALIAVDLGAESCRVSLLKCDGPELKATLVHRFPNGPVETEQGLHWPITAIEEGVLEGIRRCAALAPEGIRSIAVDGWAVDYVRLAPNGDLLDTPFCYRDPRTIASEQHIHESISPAKLRALSAIQIQRINTAYQLVADRLADRPVPRWLNLPEYLLYRLGGRPVAEVTNASHTQLLQPGGTAWNDETFALLNLDRNSAPELVPCGTILGKLQGPLADLPEFGDTVLIAPACHDTASAVAGIPLQDGSEDWAYISGGTWSLVGTVLDAPENSAQAAAGNYTNLAAAGNRVLFHKNVNGMWLLRQCIETWKKQGASLADIPELVAAAEQLPPPQCLFEVDEPELLLPGDMPRRIAEQITRNGGSPPPLTADAAPHFANLIFHSLAHKYAVVLREAETITHRKFKRICTIGGGSRNRYLNCLIELATGLPVCRGPAESSTIGNFAVQLATLESGDTGAVAIARWSQALTDHGCSSHL